jgi:CheY-like chemotaxis protein
MNPGLPGTTPAGSGKNHIGPSRSADASVNDDLFRSAWLANLRQELLAPVDAISSLVMMLLQDAAEREHQAFLADVRKIQTSADKLAGLIHELLNPSRVEASAGDWGKDVRHELRTPLNGILGYCELWLEEGEEQLLDSLIPTLREIHRLGKQLLTQIDDLVGFSTVARDPGFDPDNCGHLEMVLDVVGSMPRRQTLSPAYTGTVLVVDDNEINRDLLTRLLGREGHVVAAAENGVEALHLLRSQPFDLVLLDIIMPELNGLEVLEQLKADERLRHVPVIMISAFNEIDSVVRCLQMGAEDYLTKPFNPVLLQARLNACLEKKRLRDREVHYLEQIEKERRRADELLHVILPAPIVTELKTTNAVKPRRQENVAVLFCDIVGFTPYCDQNDPEQFFPHLRQLVEAWEESALRHGVLKIKTIGDAFMAAAGILEQPTDHPVLACVRLGQEMIASTGGLPTAWTIRVGIHIGTVVAGVIGRRQYLFDLWGDTVNTAARMESHGVPGAITLSGAAWQQVAHCCRGQSLGLVTVKGKGPLEMFRFDGFAD